MHTDGVFIGSTYGYGYPGGGDTVSIDNPANGVTVEIGDLLMVGFVVTEDFAGANADIVGANAAWTLLHKAQITRTGHPDSWWYVAYRVVDGTEPSTFEWTCGDGGPTILGYGGGIVAYHGLTYAGESAFVDHAAGDTMTSNLDAPTTAHVPDVVEFYTSAISPPVWSTESGVGVAVLESGIAGLRFAVFFVASAYAQGSMGTAAPLNARVVQGQPTAPQSLIGIWDQSSTVLDAGAGANFCGVKLGEVFQDFAIPFVNNGGRGYLGTFGIGGDNYGDPYGWVHCLGECQNQAFFKDLFGHHNPVAEPCRCDTIGTRGAIQTPRASIGFDKGCEYAVPGYDFSGPTGLEAAIALYMGLDGTKNNNIAFAGPQVYNEFLGRFEPGLLNGDTGWHKDPAVDYWVFECWAKIADDGGSWEGAGTDPAGGQFTDGARLTFKMAAKSHSDADVTGTHSTVNHLDLTTDWQFFQVIFSGSSNGFSIAADWYWPVIHVQTEHVYTVDYVIEWFGSHIHRPGYAPRGEVAIKCPHLYPYDQTLPMFQKPIWVDEFHGHG